MQTHNAATALSEPTRFLPVLAEMLVDGIPPRHNYQPPRIHSWPLRLLRWRVSHHAWWHCRVWRTRIRTL